MILGIDPGNSGAIAVVSHTGSDVGVVDMPLMVVGNKEIVAGDIIAELVLFYRAKTVYLERVHSMPRQGVASTFKFGEAYGIIQGALMCTGCKIEYVTPQEWKKSYDLIGQDKDAARLKAIELYPEMEHRLKRKKDVDRADALLIAGYGLLREACDDEGVVVQ